MPSGEYYRSVKIGNKQREKRVTKTADSDFHHGDSVVPITLPAGKTVTDWVKTDGDTAECNLPSGHGFTDGKFDVYDSDGDVIRYGVDGVIVVNALTLDGGSGTDFPASATEGIVVTPQKQITVNIDGDNLSLMSVYSTVAGHVDWQDSSDVQVYHEALVANDFIEYDSDMDTNNYTGNVIVKAMVSNGTTEDGTIEIDGLQDSTP